MVSVSELRQPRACDRHIPAEFPISSVPAPFCTEPAQHLHFRGFSDATHQSHTGFRHQSRSYRSCREASQPRTRPCLPHTTKFTASFIERERQSERRGMVQPQPDGPMQWDMSGEESGGALRVPPELAANEVVTRLLGDNQQLREALRRSNLALRQRCEEMEGWQRRTREEREFLSSRFQEARALVERLAQENHSLKGLVNGPASSSNHCCSSSQTEDQQGRPVRNGPLDGPQTLDQRERKRVEETDQHTQTTPPRSLGDARRRPVYRLRGGRVLASPENRIRLMSGWEEYSQVPTEVLPHPYRPRYNHTERAFS
ncbi:NF-kappa-B essential modulator-like isoform X1 [Lates japonicus]|uniref:NF-kappa-B essential modulator-like isoform X1 n=1 Tax=Lates japonicus TaxID=270547 RepID=A0AAD3NDZ4_LATJO|nr:NF-kappa-B essential modulator-like isoform X1 [Lates japonicus]